jgi:predicted metal-dependent HD superfamily phosphohydrolase
MARNGFDDASAQARMDSIPTARSRMPKSHSVICNDGAEEDTEELIRKLVDQALSRSFDERILLPRLTPSASPLASRWHNLCASFCCEKISSHWWRIIYDNYSDPGRFYHTLEHLRTMFRYCTSLSKFLSRPDLVMFAIYFHDIIYDPSSSGGKNEMCSADMFRKFANDCNVNCATVGSAPIPDSDIEKVHSWIVRTASHLAGPTPEGDLAYFLDMDLAILGAPPPKYARYTEQIRLEYHSYSDSAFNTGRLQVMKSFQDHPALFFSEEMKRLLELNASVNVATEIKHLEQLLQSS